MASTKETSQRSESYSSYTVQSRSVFLLDDKSKPSNLYGTTFTILKKWTHGEPLPSLHDEAKARLQ